MAELTVEQRRALALAAARRRLRESQNPGVMDAIADVGVQTGIGLGKGLSGIAGLPADLLNLGGMGIEAASGALGYDVDLPEVPGGSQDIQRWTGLDTARPPETDMGRYAEKIAEFGAGSMIGPARALRWIVPLSGAAGGVSEGVRDIAGDTAGDVAGVAGSLLAGLPGVVRSNASRLASQGLQGVTPEMMLSARELEDIAKRIGVPLMGAESIDSPALQGIASDVMASPVASNQIAGFMRGRAQAVPSAAGDAIEAALPGGSVSPAITARRAVGASEGVIDAAQGIRTRAASPYYEAARATRFDAAPSVAPILNEIDRALASVGTEGTALRRELETFRSGLADAITDPDTSIGKLDTLFKSTRERLEAPIVSTSAMDRAAGAVIGPLNRRVLATLLTNPDYAKGYITYRALSPQVNEIVGSILGRIANTGQEIGPTQIQSVVSAITDAKNVRPDDIRFIAQSFEAVDPGSFRDVARVYLENAFDQAARDVISGASPTSGTKFRIAVYGTPQQRQNTRAIMEEIAKADGRSPSEVVEGFDRFMAVMERQGRIPAVGSRTQPRMATEEMARGGRIPSVIGVDITRPGGGISNRLRDLYYRRAYRRIADALTAPDSVDQLVALSKDGDWRSKAAYWARVFSQTNRELGSEDEPQAQ